MPRQHREYIKNTVADAEQQLWGVLADMLPCKFYDSFCGEMSYRLTIREVFEECDVERFERRIRERLGVNIRIDKNDKMASLVKKLYDERSG